MPIAQGTVGQSLMLNRPKRPAAPIFIVAHLVRGERSHQRLNRAAMLHHGLPNSSSVGPATARYLIGPVHVFFAHRRPITGCLRLLESADPENRGWVLGTITRRKICMVR
jgi:hypothetical protein